MDHGTNGRYTSRDACRCDLCRAAATAYQREYRKRRHLGQAGRIPVTVVLPLLRQYRAAGYSARNIADAAGISQRHVYWMMDPSKIDAKVTLQTAMALQQAALHLRNEHPKFVPAKKPRQQIRSLLALGWPMKWISEQTGIAEYSLPTHSQYANTRYEKAEKIQALYDRVGDARGPSKHTASLARTNGYYPPAAYEEDGTLIKSAVPRKYRKKRGKNRSHPDQRKPGTRRAA